jgi:hypothetical protein
LVNSISIPIQPSESAYHERSYPKHRCRELQAPPVQDAIGHVALHISMSESTILRHFKSPTGLRGQIYRRFGPFAVRHLGFLL